MERQDEEDPVKRRVCAQVGGVVGFWQAEGGEDGCATSMCIAVFNKTVPIFGGEISE